MALIPGARPALGALCGLLLTGPALAAPPPALEGLSKPEKAKLLGELRAGNQAYDDGQYAEALKAYERGLAHADLPELHYRKALCFERLGLIDEGVAAYRAYLKAAPNAPDKRRVESEIARLASESVARQRGRVRVLTLPAGADIRLNGPDGQALGSAPLGTSLPVGEVTLHLTLKGHHPVTRRLLVRGGETTVLELTLQPATPPPAALPPPPAAGWSRQRWGWVSLGSGAGLAAAGVLLGLLAEARIEEANDYDRRAVGHTRAELDDIEGPIGGLKAATWVTGVGGLVALAAGGVLLLLDDEPKPAGVGSGGS